MYPFLIALQCISILVLLVEFGYIVRRWSSRQHSLLLLFLISAAVNAIGYLFEMRANTPETAIMGTKFSYLGKPFVIFSMVLFVLDYCKVKFPKWIMRALFLVQGSISVLVFTNEYHMLFYKSVNFVDEGLFPHLVLEHGIIYNLYTALLGIYMMAIFVICLLRYCQIKNRAEKRQLVSIIAMVVCADLGLLAFLADITMGYDTTELSTVIAVSILFVAIFKNNFLDTLEMAKDYVVDNLADGLLVLSNYEELIYTNVPAREIYPALGTEQYAEAVADIKKHCEEHTNITVGDKVYEVSSKELLQKDMSRGVMYLLSDITESYNYTVRLQEAVKEKTKEISQIQRSIIASFAYMVEARDGITGQHIKRTSAYVKIIAEALLKHPSYKDKVDENDVMLMIDAAPLHDIGKISIPDAILTKPGRLTDEEFGVIKTHPVAGADIIEGTLAEVEKNQYLSVARDMAYYHHEKWDGTGYPCGLKGEEIPLCARVMAIADVYDALRSERSYKEAFSKEIARQIIMESAGTHFDPMLVEVFMDNIEQIEAV